MFFCFQMRLVAFGDRRCNRPTLPGVVEIHGHLAEEVVVIVPGGGLDTEFPSFSPPWST